MPRHPGMLHTRTRSYGREDDDEGDGLRAGHAGLLYMYQGLVAAQKQNKDATEQGITKRIRK